MRLDAIQQVVRSTVPSRFYARVWVDQERQEVVVYLYRGSGQALWYHRISVTADELIYGAHPREALELLRQRIRNVVLPKPRPLPHRATEQTRRSLAQRWAKKRRGAS